MPYIFSLHLSKIQYMLKSISPIDGRYANKTKSLQDYFSEYALIKYRVIVEIEYLLALADLGIPQLKQLKPIPEKLKSIYIKFSEEDAQAIKDIEKTTNHDVKAVEYFIKDKLTEMGLESLLEWVHFALTSQDINNTATPLLLRDFLQDQYLPELESVLNTLVALSEQYKSIPMLSRTHGQAASPSTVGKELRVFTERILNQKSQLEQQPIYAKFGGATGNFNAHHVAFPDITWTSFADKLITDLGLRRSQSTTQIGHYDDIAAIMQNVSRINTILVDLARDMWSYISMDYFKQKVVANEVGSSAMPHKVNPIDFENAEGNFGIANAMAGYLANKLPISRLQRDLTDSTVLRNLGVPFAHTTIGFKSLLKGLGKIELNETRLKSDLEANWAVVSEGIQNILRREGYPKPYEALKALTRGNASINRENIHAYIETLNVGDSVKKEMKAITPHTYTGYH